MVASVSLTTEYSRTPMTRMLCSPHIKIAKGASNQTKSELQKQLNFCQLIFMKPNFTLKPG